MSINRINDALIKAMDKPPSANGTVFVCHATEDEWDAFVESEDPAPALKTKYLEWFEAAREIHIVEFPSAAYECLGLSVHNIFRAHANANRWLRSRGSSYNQHGRRFEPDCSFGPASSTPGAVLPRRNMEWSDFNTIKVEIGVSQQWGDRAGQLDYKALAIWYNMPGVEYVLCVSTDNTLTAAEYKLYDFRARGRRRRPPVQPRAAQIVPNTTIAFDAHRILGIPPASPLPAGFPDPFVVDLSKMAVALGVDVGTTAVKCALVDATTRALLASAYETTGEYVDCGVGRAEQSVDAILRAVHVALAKLPQETLRVISSVGICGQMHGIVWWRAADVGKHAETVLAGGPSVDPPAWSRLVTWEDQRCSQGFLAKCRDRINAAHVVEGAGGGGTPSSGLSSGYGLATFAHTLTTNPEGLAGYDACGTIHDLLAFILCGHARVDEATIDTTDACSWGAFNLDTKNWNLTSVAALGIPLEVLPQVKPPGSVIGRTAEHSPFGIPPHVRVFVPMGDHPCSVVAAVAQLEDETSASSELSLVNFGTSAQLAMILPQRVAQEVPPHRGFEIRPFITDDQVLGVAAALSGGNMFAWLVRRCHEWMAELAGDVSGSAPTKEATAATYERLIRLGLEKLETDLVFWPTLNGERTTPDARGRLDSLGLHNGSLGDLSASLCRGLVRNLVDMVPEDLHSHLRTSRVIGTGTALVRNALLQHFLSQELDDNANLRLQDAADAAVGAALVPMRLNVL